MLSTIAHEYGLLFLFWFTTDTDILQGNFTGKTEQETIMHVTAIIHCGYPDSKVHGANMGPTWDRQDPDGPHVGPMNLAIWAVAIVPVSVRQPWRIWATKSHQSGKKCDITKMK